MYKIQLPRTYTDIIRIVACLLVVIGHYAHFCYLNNWNQSMLLSLLASQAGYVGVALFFFLSGFGVNESENRKHLQFKDYIIRRIIKLYKPILLVTALWIPVLLFLLKIDLQWSSIIYELLWGFGDPVLWFIKILFGLYLSYYLYSYLKRRGLSSWVLYSTLAVVTVLLMELAHSIEGYSPISIPFFMLGVIASETKKLKFIELLIIIGFIISSLYSIQTHNNLGFHSAFNCIVLFIFLLVPQVKQITNFLSNDYRIVQALSLITLDTYLIHMKILSVMANTGIGGGNFLIFMLLVACLAYILFVLRRILKLV